MADVAPRGGLRAWRRTRPAALRRGALAVGVIVLVPALLILTGFLLLLREDTGTLPATVPVAGHDGLWVGHAWVDGRRTDRDLRALAARLRETGIRDVFAHVGPLSSDGALNPALRPRAGWLVTGLHRLVPEVRVQAWLGTPTMRCFRLPVPRSSRCRSWSDCSLTCRTGGRPGTCTLSPAGPTRLR